MRKSNTITVAVAIALALALAGTAGAAGSGDTGWQIRVYGAWVDPDLGSSIVNDDGEPVNVGSNSAFGYGVGLDYRASERISWSLDLLQVAPELTLSADLGPSLELRTEERMQVTPLLLGMGWHVTPGGPVDVAVGPVVGWVQFGDVTFDVGDEEPFRAVTANKPAIGARVAASTALGDGSWSLTGNVTYLKTDLEARNGDGPRFDKREFSYDPLIVTVGVGYRF